MKIERAIEILDPEHREHYDDMEEVNTACRMGMNALRLLLSEGADLAEVVRCRDCVKLGIRAGQGFCEFGPILGPVEPDSFCSWGRRKDDA